MKQVVPAVPVDCVVTRSSAFEPVDWKPVCLPFSFQTSKLAPARSATPAVPVQVPIAVDVPGRFPGGSLVEPVQFLSLPVFVTRIAPCVGWFW